MENLFKLIAQRGPVLTRLEPDDTVIPKSARGRPVTSQLFPSNIAQSPAPDNAANSAHSLAIWQAAKHAHYAGDTPEERSFMLPPAYASYDVVHAMIGRLIWSERQNIRKNIVHITSRNGDVVAAVYPSERKVAVRRRPIESTPGMLSFKVLPSSARRFEADIASGFEMVTVHMLLWCFGQMVPEAVEEVPTELLSGQMLLRKLPLVAPNALHLRHFQLIHHFSAGPLDLQALYDVLSPEGKKSICADLASLYVTRCLVPC